MVNGFRQKGVKRNRKPVIILLLAVAVTALLCLFIPGVLPTGNHPTTGASLSNSTFFPTDNTTIPISTGTPLTSAPPTSSAATPTPTAVSYIKMNVPFIAQLPELPTGCEAVSATMLLNYYGFEISKMEFAALLPLSPDANAGGYGYDPTVWFLGDPKLEGSRGCYAPVIEKTVKAYMAEQNSPRTIKNITGCDIGQLHSLLQQGHPIVVWATLNMTEKTSAVEWTDRETQKKITWIVPEHCLLLIGYDDQKKTYIFNDPMEGEKEYGADAFEKAWKLLGSQALYID